MTYGQFFDRIFNGAITILNTAIPLAGGGSFNIIVFLAFILMIDLILGWVFSRDGGKK